MAARKCLRCGGPMPDGCHGNAGLCSAECRKSWKAARNGSYRTARYHADPEYRERMLAKFRAYREKVGRGELAARRKSCPKGRRGDERTEEELDVMIAEQMKCLPAWWFKEGDDNA